MATDSTKINSLFKSLLGREHTSNLKEWYEELSRSTIFLHNSEILSDKIEETPPTEDTQVIQILSKHTLTEINSIPNHKAWRIIEDPNDPSSNVVTNLVHPRFGQGYNVKLYDANDTEIPTTSSVEWLFFYETGILVFEEDPTTHGYTLPLKIDTYRYIGQTIKPIMAGAPSIGSVSWDNEHHYSNRSYTLTIDAYDMNGLLLTYALTCDDPNVTIEQDTTNENVFHVTYPEYTESKNVVYTVTVTNSADVSNTRTIAKTVGYIGNVNPPNINSVTWNTDKMYEKNTYTVTIDATDPQGFDLTYRLETEHENVTIEQDTIDKNVFHVTFGNFNESTLITFYVVVTNNRGVSSSLSSSALVKVFMEDMRPVVDSLTWNDRNHQGGKEYTLTINAHDPGEFDINYSVTCDDSNVTVTQDATSPNVFHVTYPVYDKYESIGFLVTITNSNDLAKSLLVTTIVKPTNSPIINNIRWNSDLFFVNSYYIMTIDAYDPNNQNLTYSVSSNDSGVGIISVNNPYTFKITFPDYTDDIVVELRVSVTNESGVTSSELVECFVKKQDIGSNPVINDIIWNDPIHWSFGVYTLTVDAEDPYGYDLSYSLEASSESSNETSQTSPPIEIDVDDPNSPNVFTIHYPNYIGILSIVTFTVTVTNENGISTKIRIPKTINNSDLISFNRIKWNSDYHLERNSYTAVIDVTDYERRSITYSLTCDDPGVTIENPNQDNLNVFRITYPSYDVNTVVNFTLTATNPRGQSISNVFSKLVYNIDKEQPPIINSVSWNDDEHWEQNSYDLTIDATEPNSKSMTYQITCDNPDVTVTQDTTNENIFHITYPSVIGDEWVFFTIVLTNEDNIITRLVIPKIVHDNENGAPPRISQITWSDNNQYEQNTYDMTIHADDPYNLDLTYSVTVSDGRITIVQDTDNPNIFHITYPEYSNDLQALFHIKVENTYPLFSTVFEITDIKHYGSPTIDYISWDNDVHFESGTYHLTINASDPNNFPISYSLIVDDSDVTVIQDTTNPNVFHITYPNYGKHKECNYFIEVSNDKNKLSRMNFTQFVNSYIAPVVKEIEWNYTPHYGEGTYDLVVDAVELHNLQITYQVTCDDANVTITQDATNLNVFHVTYPDYTEDTDVTFTITVTNSFGSYSTKIEEITIEPKGDILTPSIDSITWNDDNQYEQNSYVMTISAADPQGLDLSYQVTCDDSDVTITQDTNDENVFHVTYPEYTENTDVTFTITVFNSSKTISTNKKRLVECYPNPVINSVSWDSTIQFVGETHVVTINAYDLASRSLTYSLNCDRTDVTITSNGNNSFTIVYPDFTYETIVNFVAIVNNDKNKVSSFGFSSFVNKLPSPYISDISWDKLVQFESQSYYVTIYCDDQNYVTNSITFSLICDNPNVTITNDIRQNNYQRFKVDYPENEDNNTIYRFTAVATNPAGGKDYLEFYSIANDTPRPILDSVSWDTENQFDEETHTLTINASYPELPEGYNGVISYSVICDEPDVAITQGTDNPNIFTVEYPDFEHDTKVDFQITLKLIDYTIHNVCMLVKNPVPPVIDNVSWDQDEQYKGETHDLTITAIDLKGLDLTYQVTCDDANVIITQDTNFPHIFHVTYPDYTEDTSVSFTVHVENTKNLSTELNVGHLVKHEFFPIINGWEWNDDDQYDDSSYDLTIDAADPQGLDLTYQVTCDDANVTITQDTNNENVFHVTYPIYTEDTSVEYTIVITNSNNKSTNKSFTKNVLKQGHPPIIDLVSWDNDTQWEQNTYELTILAHDRDNLSLTYQVTCSDPDVNIEQNTIDTNKFSITYPNYSQNITIGFNVTVTNSNSLSTSKIYNHFVNAYPPPVIDDIIWDEDVQYELNSYVMTIEAHSDVGLSLSYSVICNDPDVNINQDANDENVFHITYPLFNEDREIYFTISVENENI